MAEMLNIQVCYADLSGQVHLLSIQVEQGTSLTGAILASGILELCPEIQLETSVVGVYGKLKPAETLVQECDRIEIYRPLRADPMEARRRRAKKQRTQK